MGVSSDWLHTDQQAAYRQGWGLFTTYRDGHREAVEIQRLDDPGSVFGPGGYLSADHWGGSADLAPRFKTDAEARAFVSRRAKAGDALAQKAMREVGE